MDVKMIIEHLKTYFEDRDEKLLLSRSNISLALSELSGEKLTALMGLIAHIPPDAESPGFASWVKKSREALNLNQSEVADLLELGRDRINKLEKGTSNLSKEKANQLRIILIARLKSSNLL